MTCGRASLAVLAAAALLVGIPAGAAAERKAPAHASAKKSKKKVKRMHWRSSTRAFRGGPGVLFGGSAPGGPDAPGSPPPGGSQPGGSPTTPAPEYHALAVAAREYSLTLSRSLLTPGLQTIQLNNRGEDPHDLVISPEGSHEPLADFPETPSLDNHTAKVQLPVGRYLLWCSLPGHEALGMKATLRVE